MTQKYQLEINQISIEARLKGIETNRNLPNKLIMNDDDDVICISDSDPEDICTTEGASGILSSKPRSGPVLKGLHINPSGQSTLAFDKRIRQTRPSKIKEEEEFNQLEKAERIGPKKQPSIDSFFKSRPEGVTISVRNTQSVGGGKMELKIVVPSTSAGSEGPGTSSRPKKTARKTMSSFTPTFSKKRKTEAEVIDLSDDDDDKNCDTETKVIENVKEEKIPTDKVDITAKRDTSKPSPVKLNGGTIKQESPTKKDPITLDLSKAVDEFLLACSPLIGSKELDRVTERFNKKISELTPDPKTRKSIAVLIREKKDRLVIEGKNLFKLIQDIFGQMSLHKIDKKRRIQLTKVDDIPTTTSSNGQGKTEASNPTSAEPSTSENVKSEPCSSSSPNSTKKLVEKHAKRIKVLQKALNDCKKEIDRLESAEVDFDADEDDDSPYILVSKYKDRFMKLFRRIAELKEQDPSLGRQLDKKFKLGDVSRIPEVNIKIEKFINRNRKRKNEDGGNCFQEFPDFADILKIFQSVNEKQNLQFSKEVLRDEALKTFQMVGKRLKDRRREDDSVDLFAYLPNFESDLKENDPADKDPDLARRLKESKELAEKKMNEIDDKFILQQELLRGNSQHSNEEESVKNSDDENSVDENSGDENSNGENSNDESSGNESSSDEEEEDDPENGEGSEEMDDIGANVEQTEDIDTIPDIVV